jgi:5-enolpyruvylshikimate-3-phosphate synthase
MSAAILTLPVFAGGSTALNGKWINSFYTDEFIEISKSFGLEVKSDDLAVSSKLLPNSVWPESREIEQLSQYFHPLFWALNARLAARAGGTIRIRHHPEGANLELAEDFLAQVGFKLEQAEGSLTLSAMDSGEFKTVASRTYGWPCPSCHWGLAMALGAFIRPNLKISNPDCVSKMWPNFWHFYNRLPVPQIIKSTKPVDIAEGAASLPSGRRRIKTDVVAEPELRDDFEGGE